MGKSKISVGAKFGRLSIVSRGKTVRRASGSRLYWNCVCECGEKVEVAAGNLLEKRRPTRSCGCLQNKGHRAHPLYRRWVEMIQRCENPNSASFKHYGARGVKVCARWRNDFEAFVKDMGDWQSGQTIDRIDPTGDYCPSNCKWSTIGEQARNRRDNRFVEYRGKRLILVDAAKEIGCSPCTVMAWANKGLDINREAERFRAVKGGS